MWWERAQPTIDGVDRTGEIANGGTPYLTAAPAAAADSLGLAPPAVNAVRIGGGAKKIVARLESTSNLESLNMLAVFWLQSETDPDSLTLGFKRFTLAVDPLVTRGAGVYLSQPVEIPLLGGNWELRRVDPPVGTVNVYAWEA